MPVRHFMPHDPNTSPEQAHQISARVLRGIGKVAGTALFLYGGRNILQPEGLALVGLPVAEIISGGLEMIAGAAIVGLTLRKSPDNE